MKTKTKKNKKRSTIVKSFLLVFWIFQISRFQMLSEFSVSTEHLTRCSLRMRPIGIFLKVVASEMDIFFKILSLVKWIYFLIKTIVSYGNGYIYLIIITFKDDISKLYPFPSTIIFLKINPLPLATIFLRYPKSLFPEFLSLSLYSLSLFP